MAFLTRIIHFLVQKLSSEDVIAFFLDLAEQLAKSTDNDLDDKLVKMLRVALRVYQENEHVSSREG